MSLKKKLVTDYAINIEHLKMVIKNVNLKQEEEQNNEGQKYY